MPGVKITGLGSYLPEQEVSNELLAERLRQRRRNLVERGLLAEKDPVFWDQFETTPDWILKRTGIESRRIADASEATSDLATKAARAALEDSGLRPELLGFIVLATVTPDYPTSPPTAAIVQHRLGLKLDGESGFPGLLADVSSACTSFASALQMAYALISSGVHKKGLLIGADVMSRWTNQHDRAVSILLGDAAAAWVLEETSEGADWFRPEWFYAGGDGSQADLIKVPSGGSRVPFPTVEPLPLSADLICRSPYHLQMDGPKVLEQITRLLTKQVIPAALRKARVGLDEIAAIIFHQANLRIIEATVKRLRYRGRVPVNIGWLGNTTSASIPLCLNWAVEEGQIRPGDLVLLVAVGGGLTWGTALLRWH